MHGWGWKTIYSLVSSVLQLALVPSNVRRFTRKLKFIVCVFWPGYKAELKVMLVKVNENGRMGESLMASPFTILLSFVTYLLQGRAQIPQHFSIPCRFFSASLMSSFIWTIPCSMWSSCSPWSSRATRVRMPASFA